MIVIADASKQVETLGRFPAAAREVVPFGLTATRHMIERVAADGGCKGEIRVRHARRQPFLTDGGNYILDAHFGRIDEPEKPCDRR